MNPGIFTGPLIRSYNGKNLIPVSIQIIAACQSLIHPVTHCQALLVFLYFLILFSALDPFFSYNFNCTYTGLYNAPQVTKTFGFLSVFLNLYTLAWIVLSFKFFYFQPAPYFFLLQCLTLSCATQWNMHFSYYIFLFCVFHLSSNYVIFSSTSLNKIMYL